MKRISFALAFLVLAAVVPAAAQNQVRERRSTDSVTTPVNQPASGRDRVVGDSSRANHANKDEASVTPVKTADPKPAWGNTTVAVKESVIVQSPEPAPKPNYQPQSSTSAKLVKPTTLIVNNGSVAANLRAAVPVTTNMTSVYRVGIGDVLDIRLTNVTTKESTLFTVMKEGVVEYPLLPHPMLVSGLTTDEIARRLRTEIKVIKDARIVVSVRDFASHAVVVSGLVENPGRKVLRREVMPLFAVLAECLPRSEATIATLVRNGRETNLSMTNNQDMGTLVMAGDLIKVSAAPKQFIYLGGDIASPGEKEFRSGMTLTQGILAAGGPREAKSKARIARRNTNGFLATEEFSLPAIAEGKAADPLLQAGDRIEVHVW